MSSVSEPIPTLQVAIGPVVLVSGIGPLGTLIFSLVAFLQDLNESLLAFKLDIGMLPEREHRR